MTHRLRQRLHALEHVNQGAPLGVTWPSVRPLMLAIGASPLGEQCLTELAERQLAGLSCTAVMKRLAKLCKGMKIEATGVQHG